MLEAPPVRAMERVESECSECHRTYEHDIPPAMTDGTPQQIKMRNSLRAMAMKRETCAPCAKAKREQWDREDALDAQRRLLTAQRGRLVSSGLDPRVLERIDPSWTWSEAAVAAVKAWGTSAGVPGSDTPIGLFLYGGPGRGKSVMGARGFHDILKRRPGYWRGATKLVEDAWSPWESATRAESQELAEGRHVLVLDDLGKGRATEATQERLFSVIDALYARGTPYLITSNFSAEQIGAKYPEVGEMIVSRMMETAQFVAFQGPDLRAAQARRVLAA